MSSERRPTKKYRVRLGLVEVDVECRSKDEAIRFARTKLSDDMPRLYDVIHGAKDQEFQIDEIEADSSIGLVPTRMLVVWGPGRETLLASDLRGT